MRNSSVAQNVSGVALQLMIEQEDTRITSTVDSIKNAIKMIGKNILRLYKQFAEVPRLAKIVGNKGEIEIFFFNKSDITSDEIVFETESEISETLAQRRSMVFDLLNNGLLHDEDGKLSNNMRVKVLELLGFGLWENGQDVNELHVKKASDENLKLLNKEKIEPLEIDNHALHINEHISFMLSGEMDKKLKKDKKINDIFLQHIREHKKLDKMQNMIENGEK